MHTLQFAEYTRCVCLLEGHISETHVANARQMGCLCVVDGVFFISRLSCCAVRYDRQADWGSPGGKMSARLSYGEADAEEEGSKSMVLTTHTIMKVSLL